MTARTAQPTPARRPWKAPRVVRIGSLETLTQSKGGGPQDSNLGKCSGAPSQCR